MNFLKRLFRRDDPSDPVRLIDFDKEGLKLVDLGRGQRKWLTPNKSVIFSRRIEERLNWGFDLTDEAAAFAWLAEQGAENKGVALEREILAKNGVEVLRALFKYPMGIPGSLGMYYVGILFFPFEGFYYQINVENGEFVGPTGLREAFVALRDGIPADLENAEPVKVNSVEEMFQKMAEARATAKEGPSDAPKYDEYFPAHPLTDTRRTQRRLCETLRFGEELLRAEKFRID